MLGGTMRQVGVLAAPGIIAITEMVNYLETDHQMANKIAENLEKIPCISVNKESLGTNMVFFKILNEKINF
jgi:threonine aldolase